MSKQRAVKVIQRLKDLGLTYRNLADAVGVTERAVSYWMNYHREPKLSIAQVAIMCELLGWSIEQLNEAYSPDFPDDSVDPGNSVNLAQS